MNAVPFDTLNLAQRLEAAGMPAPVAAGASEALAEAMSGAELPTKTDLKATVSALSADLKATEFALRADLKALEVAVQRDMKALQSALQNDMKAFQSASQSEVKASAAALRGEMELLRRDLTIRLGGTMMLGVGITLTALRFMLLH